VEAARCYEAALRRGPLATRQLFYFGDVLVVQENRVTEGREYLQQVLKGSDSSFHLRAAVTLALSYAIDQHNEKALEYCRTVDGLCESAEHRHSYHAKFARLLRGVAELRSGDLDAAAATLENAIEGYDGGCVDATASIYSDVDAAQLREADSLNNQRIHCYLGVVEVLRGNVAQAERHLNKATWLAGSVATAEVLASWGYLRLAQGNLEAADSVLVRCLQVDRSHPMALLHRGYVLLCQDQMVKSIQHLQKCLQQPTGTLAYGAAQKGTAHLYLCVALYRHTMPAGDNLWKEHLQKAFQLLPDLRRGLAELGRGSWTDLSPPRNNLVTGNPPRMGFVDLTLKQADVVIFCASACGLLPAGMMQLQPRPSPRRIEASPSPAISCRSMQESSVIPKVPESLGPLPPTLVGTASTAAPASSGPSRNPSDPALGTTMAPPLPPPSPALPPPSPGTALAGRALISHTPVLEGMSMSMGTSYPGQQGTMPGTPQHLEQPPFRGAFSEPATPVHASFELRARLPPGKILRSVDLEFGECLSRGEFAVVHLGALRSTRLGGSVLCTTDVVVKALHHKDCASPDSHAAAELRAEIAMMAELCHPRLVTFIGACLEPTCIALVTELAPGGNLHHVLHVRQRKHSRRERYQLATELLEGVRYLHARTPAIAHLDIKSMNLVLDADGQHLRICDFGLARILGNVAGEFRERPPSSGGSPRYMAPECYDSNLGALSEKADVWSSGCVLIELFGSSLPYAECNNVQQILKMMLVHRCGPTIPSSVEAPVRTVVSSALAFDAHERLPIAQVLLKLQAAASSSESRSRFLWIP